MPPAAPNRWGHYQFPIYLFPVIIGKNNTAAGVRSGYNVLYLKMGDFHLGRFIILHLAYLLN